MLKEKKIGVVAHFYMDPEVQGILTAAQKHWPHIHISDSLVMADAAVKMAKAGCQFITVLGVDFMSENVRAILDQAGFGDASLFPHFFLFCSSLFLDRKYVSKIFNCYASGSNDRSASYLLTGIWDQTLGRA
jgi:hypothetical protein